MTLTTETIKLWRNNAEITAGETAEDNPEHIAAKAILALTAELLANREARPVIVVGDDGGDALAYRRLIQSFAPGTKLYTAPPAPAVPPEATPEDIPQEHNINTYSGITWAAAWNACRAAMLAQPVSQRYKFPGKWIDCTDALPQNGENIITLNNAGGVYGGYIFKRYANGRWDFVDAEEEFRVDDSITHWMPLPVAP